MFVPRLISNFEKILIYYKYGIPHPISGHIFAGKNEEFLSF